MRRLLRALVRSVLESEAALLRAERDSLHSAWSYAHHELSVIGALRPGSTLERTERGFTAHVVSSTGTRHKGVGQTASEAIRASGA